MPQCKQQLASRSTGAERGLQPGTCQRLKLKKELQRERYLRSAACEIVEKAFISPPVGTRLNVSRSHSTTPALACCHCLVACPVPTTSGSLHCTKIVGELFCLLLSCHKPGRTSSETYCNSPPDTAFGGASNIARGDHRAMVVTGRMMYGDSRGGTNGIEGWQGTN